MQNCNIQVEDSLRMDVIHEEDESNAAKMSFQYLDALRFELTANLNHDCQLIRKALNRLQTSVSQKQINKQLARSQFEQIKEKLDKFFAQKIEPTTESQLEILSYLCNDINHLLQLINENYEEQSDVFADSKYDLSSSQIDAVKKKGNDQYQQVKQKSFAKASQSNIQTETDYQQYLQPNSHRKNYSQLSISGGQQNLYTNQVNQINVKQAQSRFQSSENLQQNITTNNGQYIQINLSDYKSNYKYQNNSQDQDANDSQITASSTYIENEDLVINKPKSIDIKLNSFTIYKQSIQTNLTDIQTQIQTDNINSELIQQYQKQNIIETQNLNQIESQNPKIDLFQVIESKQQNSINTMLFNGNQTQLNDKIQSNISAQQIEKPQSNDSALFHDKTQEKDEAHQNEEKIQTNNNIFQKQVKQNILSQEQDIQVKSTKIVEEENEISENHQSAQSQNIQLENKQPQLNQKSIEQSLQNDFERIKQLFDDKYLDDVEQERIKLIKKMDDFKLQFQEQAVLKNTVIDFENKIGKELDYYQRIYQQLILTTSYIEEKEGWQQEKTKHGMSIQYKKIPNSKLLALRMECEEMEMNIKVLISIVYEIELYQMWFPFCKVGKNLKTVDKACKVVYLKMDVPFISDREVFIHGIGVNRLHKDGSIIIMARSIDKDIECQKETGVDVPTASKCVRVDIPFFTFVFKPLSETKLQLYSVCNMDAHLKLVPDSIINLVLRKFAYFLFEKMIEQNKKFKGSKWEQNMKNNPEFYEWIEREYQKFFQSRPDSKLKSENSQSANPTHKKK
ncbi:START-2 domain protein, putative (macronuclear) [Tetrahymena thermophila SB210]|uniref:START-2 domain protein, putative n=1 Tax=Tetrahymena thermophila (strain SB210) TaxID=312017 RepID=W7X1C2_TETTS|nr:START-2 domain protein, putative [Tetrahymena thermophila SB210]EWS71382.1 START-2 domain protein, putative [Tetrahymena thermophila SB210]|eukprot:XP_012656083.1 START-2 domain protein, putative [Tetrahymena thermophila SB210]